MELLFPMIMGLTALMLLGSGVAVKYYKAYWLISGYNMMTEKEKEKVDVEGLANFICNMLFLMAGIFILGTVLIMVGQGLLGGIIFAAIFPQSIYIMIRSQKYDGNSKNPDGTMNKKAKRYIGGMVAFLSIVAIGVGILLYKSNQPAEFIVGEGYFEIKGIYGQTIPLSEVEEIVLKQELPRIQARTNGSALGSMKKGSFRLEEIGGAKLFVDTSQPPFIFIQRKGRFVIVNCEQSEKTQELYRLLRTEWDQVTR